MKRVTIILALVALLVLSFTPGMGAATKPHRRAISTPVCTVTVWRLVKGPNSNIYNNGSFKDWLYALEDINSSYFCGYLHSALDYSTPSGSCNSFHTAVDDTNGHNYGTRSTSTFCSGASGSIQSAFYHSTVCQYYGGNGWMDTFPDGEATAGFWYACG